MTARSLVQDATGNNEQQESADDILRMLKMYRVSRKLSMRLIETQTAKIKHYEDELRARGVEVPDEE